MEEAASPEEEQRCPVLGCQVSIGQVHVSTCRYYPAVWDGHVDSDPDGAGEPAEG